jgi:hypothetical protein
MFSLNEEKKENNYLSLGLVASSRVLVSLHGRRITANIVRHGI